MWFCYLVIGTFLIIIILKVISDKKNNAQKYYDKKTKVKTSVKSYSKKRLMTNTEIFYYKAIKENVPKGYIVFPQINLATIINRNDKHKYQSELYRNIDFVIFDLYSNPIILIEVNDKTHHQKERWIRDQKVKDICNEAGLPIITLWVECGINRNYIKNRIEKYLKILQ